MVALGSFCWWHRLAMLQLWDKFVSLQHCWPVSTVPLKRVHQHKVVQLRPEQLSALPALPILALSELRMGSSTNSCLEATCANP